MIDRAGVRLDGDPVLRPQHVEIQRRHQGGHGGAGRLVAADLQAVAAVAYVVGVVDRPHGMPEHLALQCPHDVEAANVALRSEEHTSELQSLMRISYAVFCLKKKRQPDFNALEYTRVTTTH